MSSPGVTQPAPSRSPDEPTGQLPGADSGSERPRWKQRKFVVIAVVVLVIIAGGGVGTWLGTRSTASAAGLEVTSETVAATTGTMKETVAASGTIVPAEEADLDFAVSGKVTAVAASTGEKVTAGQKLATINSSALQDQVDAAQAALSAAQSQLSTDQGDGASASAIDSDQASVTSAQSQLTTAQTNRADATLTSTIAGTVASVDLSIGQQVSGTGSSSTGSAGSSSTGTGDSASNGSDAAGSDSSASSGSSAQVVVVSTDSFAVTTTVDDTQIGEVKVGDQADITPSSSTATVYGTVSSVGLIASSSSTVATFPVDIAVTGTPSGLYSGSTATVSIIVKQLNDVVEVPTTAISYSGANSTVTEVKDGKHVSQVITTGLSSDGETQVTKGLSSGDKVIEKVVKFNGKGGTARSLFGGSGSTGRTGFGGGGFGGGGFGGGGGFTKGGGAAGGGGFGG